MGSPMSAESRSVLAFVENNPGTTSFHVKQALPKVEDVRRRLGNLRQMGYVTSVHEAGVRTKYFADKPMPETLRVRVSAARHRPPARAVSKKTEADGCPAPRARQVDYLSTWTEPYLSDVGVRRDGLQFRECPSRRGDQFVYCWRRESVR